jgi:uncharacterized membrane protein
VWTVLKNQITGRFSPAEARVLCYALGPLSGPLMLHIRRYGAVWSVRFHAFHSLLMAFTWGLTWVVLRISEAISPSWFLATCVRQLRFAANLLFLLIWLTLLVTAYGGGRCAAVPLVHRLAVRLARRSAPV